MKQIRSFVTLLSYSLLLPFLASRILPPFLLSSSYKERQPVWPSPSPLLPFRSGSFCKTLILDIRLTPSLMAMIFAQLSRIR